MKYAQPYECGISAKQIQSLLQIFEKHGVNTHAILMARGDRIFFERYWQPYDAHTPHRMYSVTKSFVSAAIGCLADEGKLSLDDPIIRFFPDKLPEVIHPWLKQQTIRDMLMMCTCFEGSNWFLPEVTDRLKFYFAQTPVRPAGTTFNYDSTGSYVLGVVVERLSGRKLLDYLKRKLLNRIGGFENALLLETPDGTAWGDSALIATPRGLMNFARLMLNRGLWEGEQLLSHEYAQAATSFQTANNMEGRTHYNACGYGYQFWMTYENSFSMNGMGSQFAICVPHKDLIFVCTCDNQLSGDQLHPVIFDTFFREIVAQAGDEPLPAEPPLPDNHPSLIVSTGEAFSPLMEEINSVWYVCDPNPMGITRFRLSFEDNKGTFSYVNEQGNKELTFGMKHNLFGLFPQAGYSNLRGNVHEINDFRYRCAVSGGWTDAKTLQLRVQIIDNYLGQLFITFGFRSPDTVGVYMVKSAEDFLQEYQGWMGARRL